MPAVLLEPTELRWECPCCDERAVSRRVMVAPGESATEFHHCRGLAGLWSPMVPAGTRCKVTAHERDDYIGGDMVRFDAEQRPIMAVTVTREDGEDRTVYAPCAQSPMREAR